MSLVLVGLVVACVSIGLGLGHTIGLADLAVVSVGGGALASLPVLAATLGLAAGAVRFGWDLDNVTAPLVSTLGDVLTLPALWLATGLLGLGRRRHRPSAGASPSSRRPPSCSAPAPTCPLLRRIVRSSLPVLVVAAVVSALAGVVLERRLVTFSALPALLILVPAHLSSAGALGGILSGRLSSQLLLGLAPPTAVPSRAARRDLWPRRRPQPAGVRAERCRARPSWPTSLGQASPGIGYLVGASLLAGAAAMVVVIAIAYYGTIAAVRTGIDPDTYGIPHRQLHRRPRRRPHPHPRDHRPRPRVTVLGGSRPSGNSAEAGAGVDLGGEVEARGPRRARSWPGRRRRRPCRGRWRRPRRRPRPRDRSARRPSRRAGAPTRGRARRARCVAES